MFSTRFVPTWKLSNIRFIQRFVANELTGSNNNNGEKKNRTYILNFKLYRPSFRAIIYGNLIHLCITLYYYYYYYHTISIRTYWMKYSKNDTYNISIAYVYLILLTFYSNFSTHRRIKYVMSNLCNQPFHEMDIHFMKNIHMVIFSNRIREWNKLKYETL